MVDVSILISTFRKDLVIDVVNSINSVETEYNYEILIYCERKINLPNVRCIVYDEPEFSTVAYNLLYKESIGDCLIVLTDDVIPEGNIFGVYDELKGESLKNRKFKIISLLPGPTNGFLPNGFGCDTSYHIIHFPCVLRETIESEFNGVVHNEMFKHHYVYNWMGHFISKYKERVITSDCCRVVPVEGEYSYLTNHNYDDHDKEVFRRLVELVNNDDSIEYNHSYGSSVIGYEPNPQNDKMCLVSSEYPYGAPENGFNKKWRRDYKISIVMATRDRSDMLLECITSFMYKASGNVSFEFVLVVDYDDSCTLDTINGFVNEHLVPNITCITVFRSIFMQRDYNNLACDAASGDIILIVNDDVEILTDCWDEKIYNRYLEVKTEDDIHLLSVMDNGDGRDGGSFPIVTKTYTNLFNGVFHPDIYMWGADFCINKIFSSINRKHFIDNVFIQHNACHGEAQTREKDSTHNHVQSVYNLNNWESRYKSEDDIIKALSEFIHAESVSAKIIDNKFPSEYSFRS
jgi:hypothetical protein